EFQNQKRFSSFSRRASAKNAWYGYISSQPSQPGGVSIEYGLGNDPTGVDVANAGTPLLLVAARLRRARITRRAANAQRTAVRQSNAGVVARGRRQASNFPAGGGTDGTGAHHTPAAAACRCRRSAGAWSVRPARQRVGRREP